MRALCHADCAGFAEVMQHKGRGGHAVRNWGIVADFAWVAQKRTLAQILCGVGGISAGRTEVDSRLYSKFYSDKLRVGLQDVVVRAIISLAGGNRRKDDEPVRSRPATRELAT